MAETIPLMRTAIPPQTGNVIAAANMMFFSTNIVEASGKDIVVACSDCTVMGRVVKLGNHLRRLFFYQSIVMGYTWMDSLLFLIGIIVANVQEGIIATVTVNLSLTAKRMANKNCLVKNLKVIETLGCTAVICSDKTGTLMQNKITVRHIWYDGQLQEVMASDTWRKYTDKPGFENLSKVASLCNRAEWTPIPKDEPLPSLNRRKILDDASDKALLRCMEVLVKDGVSNFRTKYTKILEIPFNLTDKFQANLHQYHGKYLVCFKGAPERVLERCATAAFGNETKP